MTDQEVKEELNKLDEATLRSMAEERHLPIHGLDKAGVISKLVGECLGCNNKQQRQMSVVYIGANNPVPQLNGEVPCLNCGK